MTVAELISVLQQIPPTYQVVCVENSGETRNEFSPLTFGDFFISKKMQTFKLLLDRT